MNTPDFSKMTRREIEDYCVERAMVDSAFRDKLLTSPEELLRELGIPVGPDVKVRVLEEEPKSFYLVLPRILSDSCELDESDLDGVTGGAGTDMTTFFNGYD